MTHVVGTLRNDNGKRVRMTVAEIRVPPTFLLLKGRIFRLVLPYEVPLDSAAPIHVEYEELPDHYAVDVSGLKFETVTAGAGA